MSGGVDELYAENAMRSSHLFVAGVVDAYYFARSASRKRVVKMTPKSAGDSYEMLKEEGVMVEVEPMDLLA